MATIQQAFQLAQQQFQAGDLPPAEEICRRIVAVAPANTDALWLLGLICHNLGKLAEAVSWYQEVLRHQPSLAEVYNNLGNTLRELGRLDEAVTSLQQALRLKPDYANAHFNLGNAYRKQEKLEAAA